MHTHQLLGLLLTTACMLGLLYLAYAYGKHTSAPMPTTHTMPTWLANACAASAATGPRHVVHMARTACGKRVA